MLVKISEIKKANNRRKVDYTKVDETAESIKLIGLLNPITITKDMVLIAGAHRLEAAKKLGWTEIESNIVELDGLMAELAEIDENLIRNDLHFVERGENLMRRKAIYEELYPETKATGAGGAFRGNQHIEVNAESAPSFIDDTATKAGVSSRVIHEEIQIARDLTPSAKEVIINANIPKNEALKLARLDSQKQEIIASKISDGTYKNVIEAQREVKRGEIKAELEEMATIEVKTVQGVFDVIVIDPPWPMKKIQYERNPNQCEFDYPTMSEKELESLEIPAAESCHLWLWTTQKYLPMAFRLLEKWGFTYVCTFVWHKVAGYQPFDLPQYNCEFSLYARKGTPKFIETKEFATCFNAPRGAHSEKPQEFYDMVRRVTAGRRLDMFNRRAIAGFDGWGNEAVTKQ